MTAASTTSTDVEAIINRANVALARSQRLIASWLPPHTAEELAHAKTEEQLENEDRELFAPVPELLGLGAPLPKDAADGSTKRRELSSNEKLRQQLLGKHAILNRKGRSIRRPKDMSGSVQPLKRTPEVSKHRPNQSDEEEEDEGRTSSIRSKRSKSGPLQGGQGGGFRRDGTDIIGNGHTLAPKEGAAERYQEEDQTQLHEPNTNTHDGENILREISLSAQRKSMAPSISHRDDVLADPSRRKKKKKRSKHKSHDPEQR